MESSWYKKRGLEPDPDEDGPRAAHLTESKRPKLPALASVVVEALKVDSLQRLCSSLEPLFRRIVSEEVERALTRLGHTNKLSTRTSPPRIKCREGSNLRLEFRTRMPPQLFTGGKVVGEQGAAIHVVLVDLDTGLLVQNGPESAARLDVTVLEGDFNEEPHDDRAKEEFESHEVKARDGKRPLLTGDLQVTLKGGIGTLGEVSFTDNSSWIRSRKFRLGVKVAPGYHEGVRIREAKTEAFAVKDHRGELYKKHYPPALHDEVWRLDRIAKDGALHKKLVLAQIITVEDFLRLLMRDPQKLRSILGSGMSNRITGVVFNDIYELRGLLSNGQFLSLESLDHTQKLSVDLLVKRAYEDWDRVVEYDGKVLSSLAHIKKKSIKSLAPSIPENSSENRHHRQFITLEKNPDSQPDAIPPSVQHSIGRQFIRPDPTSALMPRHSQIGPLDSSGYFRDCSQAQNVQCPEDFFTEEVRVRSNEMLQSDDMQRLLQSFTMGYYSEENGFSYTVPYASSMHQAIATENGRGSGKAVVGWLKLKAALRWGIFVRKKAAERRAQLVELHDY
ncbi:hypothetical protein CDL15_Pgr015231 [Punica granatum]|uniref:Calmodulin-binding protein 60 E-like n=1 Tax=Punica granatum TaxID=22663 RepID=A0A218VZH3_PUNGR|nr:hypothetical protein CDL15_Pgr015231 [Punica granatum]